MRIETTPLTVDPTSQFSSTETGIPKIVWKVKSWLPQRVVDHLVICICNDEPLGLPPGYHAQPPDVATGMVAPAGLRAPLALVHSS